MYRFRGAASYSGSGAIASNYSPAKPVRRKFVPKPHLEKIGGMQKDVRAFISQYCDLSASASTILRTSISESILQLPKTYETIVNLKRVNDIKEINHFFYSVNLHLPMGGKFVGCVETKYLRRQRIMKKFPPVLNSIYYVLDFILKRVFPKLPVTRSIYYWLTGGRNKVMSRTETLGR